MPAELASSEVDFDAEETLRIVRRSVRAACGPAMQAQADDIAQTVMVRVVARLRDDPQRVPRTASYLWKMAHHAVIDEIRRRRRRPQTEPSEDAPTLVASDGDPERATDGVQIGAAINECVLALPDERQTVVTLFLQGHGVAESSRIVGWPRKRVENLAYRGLAAVRKCLQRKGVTP